MGRPIGNSRGLNEPLCSWSISSWKILLDARCVDLSRLRTEKLATTIKMGRPSQEIALALQLPVLGTFWRVPERFWEPSRRFLNRVFTGFFFFLFLCCFSCFFLFLSSFFCFFISSFNSFFFSFCFLFVHISNYVWEFQKIFPFQIRASKFVLHFKICSQYSKIVRALKNCSRFQICSQDSKIIRALKNVHKFQKYSGF